MLSHLPPQLRRWPKKPKQPPYRQEQPHHAPRDGYDQATLAIGIFGLIVLIAYTLVTGYQAILTRRAVKVTQGQLNEMQAEQRPVFWYGRDLGTPEYIPNPKTGGGQVVWSVHFTNYGKSFITGGRQRKFISLGNRPFIGSYRFDGPNYTRLPPLAPGQDMFDTVVSPPGVQASEFQKWQTTMELGVRIKIITDYTDLSGKEYEAVMCLQRLNTGAIMFCPSGNGMK